MTEFEPNYPRQVLMAETDAEIIDRQITEGLLAAEDMMAPSFLNNFHTNLPNGYIQGLINRMGDLDTPMIDVSEIDLLSMDGKTLRYSNRALSTTWRNFFLEVDEVLDQLGITPDKADCLRSEAMASTSSDDLTAYLLPAYRELRLRGFAHGELVR